MQQSEKTRKRGQSQFVIKSVRETINEVEMFVCLFAMHTEQF